MDLNPIVLSIPIYFLLIGVELLVQYFSKDKIYRLNDAVTNISCGVTQQVTNAFLKIGLVAVYQFVYEHFALFTIERSIWSYIVLFILVDFCYYWAHRMSHEVSLFWGGHVVHHQSEDYNFSVALRQGSFQIFWTTAFYLPLAVLGFNTIDYVLMSGLVTVYQFWIHTEKIGNLGPIEWIFNTPSHHRVHHGRNPKYIDKNHAGVFIIWDRMFGTFQEEEERPVYGITSPTNSWNPVWVNFQYYAYLWDQFKQTKGFKDKIKLMAYKPGWRPDYLGGYMPPPDVDMEKYKKFDIPTPTRLNIYVLVQYVLVLGVTAIFLFNMEKMDLLHNSIFALFIILSVVSIGFILELRKESAILEIVRIATTPMVIYLLFQQVDFFLYFSLSLIYVLSSYLWLYKVRSQIVNLQEKRVLG